MVQLKSFRYVETSAGDRSNCPNERPHQGETATSRVETQTGTSSSTLSTRSMSITAGGGNLIGDSGSRDEQQMELTKEAIEEETLSSREESQVVRHDVCDDESSGGERKSSIESLQQAPGRGDDEVTRIEINNSNQYNQTPETPLTPRLRLFMPRSQTSPALINQAWGKSTQLRQAAMTPAQKRYVPPNINAGTGGDNTSQYSFGQQAKNPNAQFEIRWQNLKLMARRSKIPRFIEDNPVYKMFVKNPQNVPEREEVCYSPPIQHKIPPTINEDLEMNSKAFIVGTESPSPVDASSSNGYRCILNNISGSVFSCQLTAILGPSGVGKTTLLNSLTGRNTLDGAGRVSLIGGASKRMSVVTVPQNDVLPGKLTTMEDLLYTSRLKNPQSGFDHNRNIQQVVNYLHMEKFLHTRIDKLSGGEARRLSIARELLSSPDIMILDEPTSGLDANTCKKIITALRDIVERSDNILTRPMSIIVTIHQPQQEVYNLFHRVYVMAIGGRVIYEGPPTMLLPTILEHSSLSKVIPVDQLNENPAIVAIEVASGEYGHDVIEELDTFHETKSYEEFCIFGQDVAMASPVTTPLSIRQPRRSPLTGISPRVEAFHRKRLNSIDSSIGRPTPIMMKRNISASQMDKISNITSVSYASTYDAELPKQVSRLKVDKRLRRSIVMKSDYFSHTWTLMQRCWLLSTRNIFLMSIRIIGFLLVAAGTVQIFAHALVADQHQCPQYQSEVEDIVGFMDTMKDRLNSMFHTLRQANSTHLFFFHVLLCTTMVTSALTGLVFPLQMRMFMREYKNGWYTPGSFVTSQTLAELPVDIIGPLLTVLITYPLCHQPVSLYYWREIGYALVLMLCAIICKSQAQIIGAVLVDSIENSVFISCCAVTLPALVSGVPLRVSQMLLPFQWISYLSFLRYSFECLLAIRYGYGLCPCDSELVHGYPINASTIVIPNQLDNMARGFIELYGNQTKKLNLMSTQLTTTANPINGIQAPDSTDENIFVSYVRLVTDASNLFLPGAVELGKCETYRSLYLIAMDVPNNVIPRWFTIMVVMFIVSRFLTYFVVKIVIRLRRS